MSASLQVSAFPSRPQFLKVSELAAMLKVKPRTIYEMVSQRRIPYRKLPGSNLLRFDLDEIVAWTKAESRKRLHRLLLLPCGHSLWSLQPQGERCRSLRRRTRMEPPATDTISETAPRTLGIEKLFP